MKSHPVQRAAKRSLDLIASAVALGVLSPILLVIAVLVLLVEGRPILFRQPRPGLNGRIFTIYKFRTMSERADPDGRLLSDQDRVTALGRWLRRTSLDELPELWNIAKGDMSFVGPRPLLVQYLALYSETQNRRHEVRPGLTGLAQASGRNRLTWTERFALDVAYVDEWSLWLDLKIISQTITEVIHGRDAEPPTSITSEPFRGS